MTGSTEPLALQLPRPALDRLDELAAIEGGTRDDVARRLLLAALGEHETAQLLRDRQYSLLDIDEDLAGP